MDIMYSSGAGAPSSCLSVQLILRKVALPGTLVLAGFLAGCAGSSTVKSSGGTGNVSVTWNTPAAVPVGTALSSTQLDATANVAGTFAYDPPAGTVMSTAGTTTLKTTFTPTDTSLPKANASVQLTVNAPTGPTIATLSTTQGAPATPVVITGVKFGSTQGTVSFGSKAATVSAWSDTSITATAPSLSPGAANVTVTAGGTTSAASNFTVLAGQNVCGTNNTVSINSDAYLYEQDEWNSTQEQCATVNGSSFLITAATFNLPDNGPPATFPSIFIGCDWGRCSDSTASHLPLQAGNVAKITTSVGTVASASSGSYNVAYNLWFNHASTAAGQPDAGELMVWLNSSGGAEPYGSKSATASIGGANWDVWTGTETANGTSWKIITYVQTPGATGSSSMDLAAFLADAMQRGSIDSSWYLLEVQMGFEIWSGGIGLGANDLSMTVTSK